MEYSIIFALNIALSMALESTSDIWKDRHGNAVSSYDRGRQKEKQSQAFVCFCAGSQRLKKLEKKKTPNKNASKTQE